jgi:hypothetical protein
MTDNPGRLAGDYVQVVHDPEVRALIDSGEFYRVTEDHWNEDYTIRTIIKAEVDRDAD